MSTNLYSNNRASLIGLTYPLKLNGRGGASISTDEQRVEEQILEILQTRLTERVMRLRFGTSGFIFETFGSSEQLMSVIQNQLNTYLTETVKTSINAEIDNEGTVFLTINWKSANPSSRFAEGVVTFKL